MGLSFAEEITIGKQSVSVSLSLSLSVCVSVWLSLLLSARIGALILVCGGGYGRRTYPRWMGMDGGDVAQLVERGIGTLLTHGFDSPVRQGIFLPESTFSADSLTGVRNPCNRMV